MNTVDLSNTNIQPLKMNEGSVSGASGLGIALVKKIHYGQLKINEIEKHI